MPLTPAEVPEGQNPFLIPEEQRGEPQAKPMGYVDRHPVRLGGPVNALPSPDGVFVAEPTPQVSVDAARKVVEESYPISAPTGFVEPPSQN